MLLSTSWAWWRVRVVVGPWASTFLSLAPGIMSICVLKVVLSLHVWRLEVPGGPCPCLQPPTSDVWAQEEAPRLLWHPTPGGAAVVHSHPQLARAPAACGTDLLTHAHLASWPSLLTCPSPVSASRDYLPSKPFALVILSHDRPPEEHSLWRSPPNTLFFSLSSWKIRTLILGGGGVSLAPERGLLLEYVKQDSLIFRFPSQSWTARGEGDHLSQWDISVKQMEGLPQWLRGKGSTCNAEDSGDTGSVPGWGSSPGGGHGNPLQCSCLENPTDRGACWATVHRVTKESEMTEATEHACNTTIKKKTNKKPEKQMETFWKSLSFPDKML